MYATTHINYTGRLIVSQKCYIIKQPLNTIFSLPVVRIAKMLKDKESE